MDEESPCETCDMRDSCGGWEAIAISNYYLCYECENFRPIEREFDCDGWCVAGGKPMKVMYDHHGRDGRRYEEPKDVCEHYEQRRGD